MHAIETMPRATARAMPHYPNRRAGDTGVARAVARDRALLSGVEPCERRTGWVDYALARAQPTSASAEYIAGYQEARECAIDIYSARAAIDALQVLA